MTGNLHGKTRENFSRFLRLLGVIVILV